MTHEKKQSRISAAVFAIALAQGGATAWAQESTPAAMAGGAESDDGSIVVTARRREENLQDVPDSIAVLRSDQLEAAGIENLDEAADAIPNVSFVAAQDAGTVAINVRGIGQVRNGEPPVAINIDGVQLVSPEAINQALFDLERIEVLKGPQGALYGRNAIGGAINIVTRAPTNEFEGRVRTEYASGDDFKLSASVSGPIVPDLLVARVSGELREADGLIDNVTLGRPMDFVSDRNVRGRLLFTPAPGLSFDLRGGYGRLKAGASWYIPLEDGQPNDTTQPVVANELGRSDRESTDLALKADLEIGGYTLTSISAYSNVDYDFFEDLDWLPSSDLSAAQSRDVRAYNQEFRITSPSSGPFRWVAGLSLLDSTRKIDTILGLGTLFGFDPYLQVPVARTSETSFFWGGYAQANWNVMPRLEITMGIRYDEDRREQTDRLGTAGVRKARFTAWQPKLSLAYDLTDEHLLYATVARGFRSGGFNPPTNDFPAIYEPETTTNYEAGLKTRWFDRRLTLNLAAFRIDYSDQQVFILKLANQGVVNIAQTRITGFEIEASGRLSNRLQLNASLGLIDSEITDFDGTGLYRGNQVPLTYGWSYAIGAQYRLPLGRSALTFRVDYSGRGDNYWHIDNDDRQNAVHLVNVRASLERGPVTLSVFAENLLDRGYTEEFFARQFSNLFSDIRFPGTPRRIGVSATFRF